MSKWRKKPVVIEARQYVLGNEAIHDLRSWSGARYIDVTTDERDPDDPNKFIKESVLAIRTLEGEMVVSLGDWIICGVRGEFYPCKPDIFAATYEAVTA